MSLPETETPPADPLEPSSEADFDMYPPYVQTAEQRERWDVCVEAAEATSRKSEPSGKPDKIFVWTCTRSLYHSDMPTGTAADRVE